MSLHADVRVLTERVRQVLDRFGAVETLAGGLEARVASVEVAGISAEAHAAALARIDKLESDRDKLQGSIGTLKWVAGAGATSGGAALLQALSQVLGG